MNRSVRVACATVVLVGLGACAAGSREAMSAASGGDLPQFLLGVWHGLIAPAMLMIEVINRLFPHVLPWTVRMFEVNGTGVVYDVGFYLGLAGSPALFVSRWRRPRS